MTEHNLGDNPTTAEMNDACALLRARGDVSSVCSAVGIRASLVRRSFASKLKRCHKRRTKDLVIALALKALNEEYPGGTDWAETATLLGPALHNEIKRR